MIYYEIKYKGEFDSEFLTGILWQWPIESIVTEDHGLSVYISEDQFDLDLKSNLIQLGKDNECEVVISEILPRNWNEEWEKHFQPVSIHNFCHIRADFHPERTDFEYEIIINPKMAFGTAHHETTYMMIEAMTELELTAKSVFDFGTGTGILAILAEKMGADSIYANDIDEKSIANALENTQINGCKKIALYRAEIADSPKIEYDLILANINVNVLRVEGDNIISRLAKGGMLFLSGIMIKHHEEIIAHYETLGLTFSGKKIKGEWTCLSFHSE